MPDQAYEVIKAVRWPVDIEVNHKKMPFGKLGAFRVRDQGVANEIRDKYKGDVTVTKVNTRPVMEKKLHPNRITSPGMPWHKYDELGKIIREEGVNDTVQHQRKTGRQKNNLRSDREQK